MKLRPLGSTGIHISPIGLGTVKLGRDTDVKYPQPFSIPDDTSATYLLDRARELGINLLDTAPAYGNSEIRLGKLLGTKRKEWVVCTKVGEEYESGKSSFDFSGKHVRFSIERSLKRLHTDYLDIVLVHSDGNDSEIIDNGETLQELSRLKQEGLIRAFGVSTKTVAGGLCAAECCDVVMATYNLRYRDEETVIDRCLELKRGLLVKKAFDSGQIAATTDDFVTQSMDFVFSHSGVSGIIVGTINSKHLQSNIEAVEKALLKPK